MPVPTVYRRDIKVIQTARHVQVESFGFYVNWKFLLGGRCLDTLSIIDYLLNVKKYDQTRSVIF